MEQITKNLGIKTSKFFLYEAKNSKFFPNGGAKTENFP
jgi:hypothetical protein